MASPRTAPNSSGSAPWSATRACHSESAAADEESPHLKAHSVRKNAGMLLPQGGISMTDPKVVLLEPWRREAEMKPSEARLWGVEFGGGGIDAGRLCR